MTEQVRKQFSAPWLLAMAFLVFTAAVVEKGLNLVGLNIPFLQVYPRQLLDWAVVLAIFEIALTLRQISERDRSVESVPRPRG